MPASKKKRATLEATPSTSEPSSPMLSEQQVFHQHLRMLARCAIRVVIEEVMREELNQFQLYAEIARFSCFSLIA